MPKLDKTEIATLRSALTPEQDKVAFKEGTERPGSSGLNEEKRNGTYQCAVCGNPLFGSRHKYESGSGWPSFFDTCGEGSLETKRDFKLIIPRTEMHCANCGAHVGHVFNDGPQPTGQRWCANGIVLDFVPEDGED
ncbi:peptide-methionine (R)-S-oxide reductase [Marinicauda pacifica]|jgi:peptide-methionine (R)-S-oxide reductase|uniref:peptide-methionine (R)-S-oxide reductase n=1 Tax=Marinicauda pacifica TaxID=1133559 RepID=A0A4S2HD52_9PROT|nr:MULTISPECIES: peptide-methionine (R)-S-oxide reductase MsrB [Marinicauda]TGY93914.1 peptide-methionine (R)-S-oxide reductase MsrB [Marinicauda pacifica]GGE31389.1 peptide-methionine (R)-S-oxide reductase [Marinicauda pacifica]